KTSSVPISISGNVTVDDSLYMQMGMLCLGNYDLTLSQTTADIYFTNGSADTLTKIVTDGAGKGYLYKQFPSGLSLPAYTFPIAGSTNTSDYSPATITFASNTTAGLVGARVTNSADLQLATDYLKKYWSFKTSGLTTYSYTADFKYSASDIVGTESNYKVCQFNTSKGWTEHTSESAVNTGTHDLQLTVALTNVNDSLNKSDFTGGKCPSLYFETTVSGNWSDPSIWEISTDSTFQSSTTVNYSPNSTNSAGIYVHDAVKVDYNLAIDQTLVSGDGQINILNGKILTISDGSGTDLDVQEGSSVDNAGTINNTGQIKVENDAYYIHDQNGGTVPLANWGVNSTCKIKSAGTAPAGLVAQNFGNFEYDSIGRTLNLSGNLNIQNNLILTNGVLNAASYTINVTGSITGTGDLSFTSGVLNIWSNYTNTGAFNCTTCTVNYNSNDNYQYLKGTPNYYRLNIKGSNNKGIYGDIKVNGPFNVYAGNSFYCQNAQNPPIAQNVTFNDSVTYNGTLFYTDTNTVTYGSTSINQNVIPVTYYNLVKTGAGGTANLTADIEVQNKFNVVSGTFKCNNFNLTLDGDATNTGTFVPDNNTVNYAGATNQTVIPVKYYNLTKTNIGTATISSGNLIVNKNLYIENSSILSLGTSIKDTVYGTTTIIGTLAFGGTSVNSLVLQDSLKGGAKSVLDMTKGAHYLKLNGVVNTFGLLKTDGVCSTVEYSRTAAPSDQLIIASPNYRNLVISGTGKKTLGGNTSVGCILTLSNNLYVNVYNITIGSAGSVISGTGTFDKNHMVVTDSTGCFIKNGTTQSNYITTYPVGTSKTGGPYYSPLIVKKMTATIAGTVGLSVCARPFMHPNVYTNHSGMTRYWKVDTIGSGMSNVNADLYFIFPPADYHAGKGEIPGYWDGEYFVHPVNPGFSAAAAADTFYTKGTCILYGDWTQLNFRNYYYTYYPGGVVAPGTSDWNTASTWTLDNTGRNLYGSAIPGPSDSVVILSQRTVTVSSNINTASLSVAINSGGILNLGSNYFTSGLSTFCGQGTLRTSINSFPTVNILNTFCGTTGGTVEYYWTGSALMPSVQTYYNLVLNLDQTASVANIMHNLTVYNNFTVQRGTFMICKDTAAGANPATDQRLVIDVQGNVEVSSNGAITTGNRRTNTNRLPGAFGGTPPYSTCANLPNAGYDGGSSVPYFYDIYH
ncbi:MAG: hypothetical protein Q8880_12460, partial [Bacteroidota bacterium]|nr:hypothetical protein [Bacteroidota bacterium]